MGNSQSIPDTITIPSQMDDKKIIALKLDDENIVAINSFMNSHVNGKSICFDQSSIIIETKSNNGIVGLKISKCFFIAICDGLEANGLTNYLGFPVTPEVLMMFADFFDQFTMFDFYRHSKNLSKLIENLPGVQLQFFIGNKKDGQCYGNRYPDSVYGANIDPKVIIRILNFNVHFEYITTSADNFLPFVEKNKFDVLYYGAIKNQADMFKQFNQLREDEELAKRIDKELNKVQIDDELNFNQVYNYILEIRKNNNKNIN